MISEVEEVFFGYNKDDYTNRSVAQLLAACIDATLLHIHVVPNINFFS